MVKSCQSLEDSRFLDSKIPGFQDSKFQIPCFTAYRNFDPDKGTCIKVCDKQFIIIDTWRYRIQIDITNNPRSLTSKIYDIL